MIFNVRPFDPLTLDPYMNTDILQFTIGLAVWLILVLLAGVFAAADTALARLRTREIVESESADHTIISRWLRWAPTIRAAVAVWRALLIVGAAATVPMLANAVFTAESRGIWIGAVAAGIFLSVLFGELVPRYLGASFTDAFVFRAMRYFHFWSLVTQHLNALLLKVAGGCARAFGARGRIDPFASDEDDSALAEMGEKSETLEADEHEMIKSIFEFGETVVREVMVPRTEMIAVPSSCRLTDAIETALEAGHSRLPVYEEDVDHVVGVFYLRDALKYWKQREDDNLPGLSVMMHKAFFVPETKKVNELLSEFQATKTQLAIIVDEYGGTSGLATLEDILEEIVGEIHDEFDVEEHDEYEQIDENTFIIDAGMMVDDVNDLVGIHLPEEEDFDTLGGYVMYKLGHLPTEGETIKEREFTLKILKVTDRRAEQLELTRTPGAGDKEEEK